jgi:hypothetical protein
VVAGAADPHCRHVAARVCSHHHPGCLVFRVARCVAQLSRSSPEIDRHEHRPATLPSWGYARVSYWRRISEHCYGWSPRTDADLVGEITGYVSSEICCRVWCPAGASGSSSR